MNAQRSENEFPSLINIGSCGLHVVHGAFRTGFQSVDWYLQKILKAIWRFFHDSHAWRDTYVQINSSLISLWVFVWLNGFEGEHVAASIGIVWPNVFLLKSPKPRNNKSYDTLVKHHIDSLMLVEIQFFTSVFQTCLTQFQRDVLLVPFINNEMVQLFTKIMQFFIKQSMLKEASSDYKLMNIDVIKKEIRM